MKNKALKHYHTNKLILDAAADTINIMCVVLLTANKLYPKIMYPKAVCRFVQDRADYCQLSDGYEKDDVFDYKMQRTCDELGITADQCAAIVDEFMHPFNKDVRDVYINNVKLLFIQLSREHGIGKDRRAALITAALHDKAETKTAIKSPLERVQAMGAQIEIGTISQIDCTKYRKKPEKVTLGEAKRAAEGLQWLKAYHDHVLKESESNG